MDRKRAKVVESLQRILGPRYGAISDFNLDWILRSKCRPGSMARTYELLRDIGLGDAEIIDNATLLALSKEAVRKSYDFLKGVGLTEKEMIASPQLLLLKLDRLKRNHQTLCRMGLGARLTQHHHLLYRDPRTLKGNYRFLRNKGLSKEKILVNASLLANSRETIKRHWSNLRAKGLSNRKIATNAHLLQLSPETIDRNYRNLRRLFSRERIALFAPLLGIPPKTVDANVLFLGFLGIDPTRYPLALFSSPQRKRMKVAWLVRQLFDAESTSSDGRKAAMEKVRRLVRENPKLLIYSVATLERMREKVRRKARELEPPG